MRKNEIPYWCARETQHARRAVNSVWGKSGWKDYLGRGDRRDLGTSSVPHLPSAVYSANLNDLTGYGLRKDKPNSRRFPWKQNGLADASPFDMDTLWMRPPSFKAEHPPRSSTFVVSNLSGARNTTLTRLTTVEMNTWGGVPLVGTFQRTYCLSENFHIGTCPEETDTLGKFSLKSLPPAAPLTCSCHQRQKPQAPTPQAPIRNRLTRKIANAKGLNRNTNLT